MRIGNVCPAVLDAFYTLDRTDLSEAKHEPVVGDDRKVLQPLHGKGLVVRVCRHCAGLYVVSSV